MLIRVGNGHINYSNIITFEFMGTNMLFSIDLNLYSPWKVVKSELYG